MDLGRFPMRRLLWAALALLISVPGLTRAEPARIPPPVTVPPIPAGASARPVEFNRLVIKLKDGQIWARLGLVIACDFTTETVHWNAETSEFAPGRFKAIFEEEAIRAGFGSNSTENLFEKEAGDNLQAGVIIKDMHARLCGVGQKTGPDILRGTMWMIAEWQIYDPLKREVVARVHTIAGGEEKSMSVEGPQMVVNATFRESVRALLADPGFRKGVLTSRDATASVVATAEDRAPIVLKSGPPVGKRSIGDATGSVVAIFTGDGHGSGFLVSQEGYVLTNQHVVGSAKTVRIRWSDGFETTGEVVRTDRRRDVALVKTDTHGRAPLALRQGGAQAGENVYAIGTPLSEDFQGTVTRGVVSATRIYDGFNFIQSDVSVNSGNSGGPLLDEKGAVVAITVSAYRPDGVPTGINLFIPIRDALDFLNLKPGI